MRPTRSSPPGCRAAKAPASPTCFSAPTNRLVNFPSPGLARWGRSPFTAERTTSRSFLMALASLTNNRRRPRSLGYADATRRQHRTPLSRFSAYNTRRRTEPHYGENQVKHQPTLPTRRDAITGALGAAGLLLAGCRSSQPAPPQVGTGSADVTLRIGTVLVEIAKDHTISTIGYNGSVPGPLIRLKEGVPVTVDLFNETDAPEFVHRSEEHTSEL